MTTLRAMFFVFLTTLLTLTGIGAAAARGHMAADGVICGTGEFRIVLAADGLPLFDDDGTPVAATDLPCLDCTFAALGLAAAPAEPAVRPRIAGPLGTTPFTSPLPHRLRMDALARAPPAAL